MRSPPPEAGQDCSKVFVRRRPHCDVPSPQSQEESIEASPSPLPGSKFTIQPLGGPKGLTRQWVWKVIIAGLILAAAIIATAISWGLGAFNGADAGTAAGQRSSVQEPKVPEDIIPREPEDEASRPEAEASQDEDPTCNMLSLYNLGFDPDTALETASFGFSDSANTEGCCAELGCKYAFLELETCGGQQVYSLTCCEDDTCTGFTAELYGVAKLAAPNVPTIENAVTYHQLGNELVEVATGVCTSLQTAVVAACTGLVDLIVEEPTEVASLVKGALVWEDNFDGNEVNEDIWIFDLGNGCPDNCFFGNAEEMSYQKDSCQVYGGFLHMLAEPSPNPAETDGMPYTSCKMYTNPDYSIETGRIEIRAQVVKGGGSWPSLFMLPDDNVYGGWPQSGEIDIMETVNTSLDLVASLHYGDKFTPEDPTSPKGQNGCKLITGIDYSLDFHEFALEWTPASISWFIDGTRYCMVENWFTTAIDPAENPQAPYDAKFHLILNLAVGGTWPGQVDAASMPWDMQIDYVRVYELTEEQATYEGSLFPGPITEPTVPVTDGEAYPYLTDVDGQPLPWKLPTRLDGAMFDYGGQGVSFFDNDPEINNGDCALRRNYGVDLFERDVTLFEQKFTSTYGASVLMEPGEWLSWTVDAGEGGFPHKLKIRYGSEELIHFKLLLDSNDCQTDGEANILEREDGASPGFNASKEFTVDQEELIPIIPAGIHTITYCCLDNPVALEFIYFGHDINGDN